MATDGVSVVREAYEAFGRGDIPTVLGLIDPKCVWIESASAVPIAGTHIGPEAVAKNVFAAVPANFTTFELVPGRFIASGDLVITTGVLKATAKATGRSMEAPYAHVFTVTNGKITRLENYHDTGLWKETLGL